MAAILENPGPRSDPGLALVEPPPRPAHLSDMTLGWLSVLIATGVLLAGCGQQAMEGDLEQRYEVVSSLLQAPGKPVMACWAYEESFPPGCGAGIEVTGIAPGAVAQTTRYDDGTLETPLLRIVGTWDGSRLTATEPAAIVDQSTHEPRRVDDWVPSGTGCSDPGGIDQIDEPLEYERQIARVTEHPAVEWSWRSENRILNLAVTGRSDRLEAELRSLYDWPLCVVDADQRRVQLLELEARVSEELKRQHILVVDIGVADDSVDVILAVGEPETVQRLTDQFGEDLHVSGWARLLT